jgi:hypothetical protein
MPHRRRQAEVVLKLVQVLPHICHSHHNTVSSKAAEQEEH